MRLSLTTYSTGTYREVRLPAIDNTDYTVHLEAGLFSLPYDLQLRMEVLGENWRVLDGDGYQLFTQSNTQSAVGLDDGTVFIVSTTRQQGSLTFIATKAPETIDAYEKYDISSLDTIKIGSEDGSHIRYRFQDYVSKEHALLHKTNGGCTITDTSTNGILLNGNRIASSPTTLQYGDEISILGLKIVYLGSIIALESTLPGLELSATLPMIRRMSYTPPPRKQPHGLFSRTPRRVTELATQPMEIEAPPTPNQQKPRSLLLTIGPSITMMVPMTLGSGLAIIGANASGGTASLFMYTGIITAGASAIIGVIWALVNMRYLRREREQAEQLRQQLYTKYLEKCTTRLQQQYTQNANILRDRYPSAIECCAYDRSSSQLWNRNTSHPDFLHVRLGVGEMQFQVDIKIPKERFALVEDLLSDKPAEIYQQFHRLKDVPVGIDLADKSMVGIYGDGSMENAMTIARSMAVQIAAHNCYTDVKMVFLYNEAQHESMGFARWLPHVWSEDRKIRYVASDNRDVREVLYTLGNVFRQRSEQAKQEGRHTQPHYVVFVCDHTIIEGEPAAKYLLDPQASELGICTVMLAKSYEQLPNRCSDFIQWDSSYSGMHGSTISTNKHPIAFDAIPRQKAEAFARGICPIRVSEMELGGEIPATLGFLDMLGVTSVGQLQIQDNWKKSRTYESLKALIGQKGGGSDVFLDIHEKFHGPHGLVAGTTGSGKSETLQTYIMSLAIGFSPLDVGFLIIDFKGAGMAKQFSGLPHLMGQISNLSGNRVRRAMVSIKSEIKRRQRILGEYNVNHLDLYTRLLKDNEASEPLPHLIIIIDEFAELKREEPEFMRELISVAQVGRSLGIHLILATQKPAGTVDDNIWSNSRFKLCLRVQDRQDSMDMLKQPDAAFITQTGQGYLQVGNNEILDLFQSGWSGAIYDEDLNTAQDELAVIITQVGQPMLASNKHLLKLKEQKRRRWFSQLMDCFQYAADAMGMDAVQLCDKAVEATALEHVSTAIASLGLDYPRSTGNDQRLCNFLQALANTEASDKEQRLDALISAAEAEGSRMPELREKTQLAVVVEHIAAQAQDMGLSALTLWLDELKPEIYLDELEAPRFDGLAWPPMGEGYSLYAPLGKYDDLANQTQPVLGVDFASGGHMAVCGRVRSGKSTLMQTLLYSLVQGFSPRALNIYIIDYSSRLLDCFAHAPHCGGVVVEGQQDRAAKLFAMLAKEVEHRKRLLHGGDFAEYVRTHNGQLPAIIIAIDGFSNFSEKTGHEHNELLIALSREGAGLGIYLLLSAGGFGANNIPSRIAENIKTTLSLDMGEQIYYQEILRVRPDILPEADVPGRGLAVVNGKALEYQAALPLKAEDNYKRIEALAEHFRVMAKAAQGEAARPIPSIPDKPTWQHLSSLPEYADMVGDGRTLPLGYSMADAGLLGIDLFNVFTYMVAGWQRSGKSNLMRCLALAAKDMGGQRVAIGGDMAIPADIWLATDEEIDGYIRKTLHQEITIRSARRKELAAKGLGDEEIFEDMRGFDPIFLMVDDYIDFTAKLDSSTVLSLLKSFTEDLLENGFLLNIYVFASIRLEDIHRGEGRRAFDLVASRKTGILLGGNAGDTRLFKLFNFPLRTDQSQLPAGIGLLPVTAGRSQADKVVLPLARQR